MKFFPIKVAVICLLITPLLYILTLMSCETYLTRTYSSRVQNILIGDSKPLLDGTIRLEELVARHISDFLKNDWKIHYLHIDLNILVTTSEGRVIYPVFTNFDSMEKSLHEEYNAEKIAKHNFDSLNKGLIVKVDVNLTHGSTFANIILILYSGISLCIFFVFYKIGSSRAYADQQRKNRLINDLRKEEKLHNQILNDLKKDRQALFENIKSLNAKYQEDRKKAKINEEEMFEEIISLEEKINAFIELKNSKEEEIAELKSKIRKYERRKSSKIKRNEFDFTSKRFAALYKNTKMNRKALSGFLNLTEDQQIKAEETIQLMDRDPDKIIVKRKVFSGKKHKKACFEVLFAYNGRLYFTRGKNNTNEILVIGTKNTQTKDMEFLHSL